MPQTIFRYFSSTLCCLSVLIQKIGLGVTVLLIRAHVPGRLFEMLSIIPDALNGTCSGLVYL
jgi:hypothetical protein